jgi:hypothetical protein
MRPAPRSRGSAEVLQRIEHDLDVEAIRIGVGELRTETHGSAPSGRH